jgi:hypothetical protein
MAAQKEETLSYGKILEVKEVMGYDYLKVDQNGTERWVAIAKAPVKVGDMIGYDTNTVMKNFKSKSLNRTFDEIVFANEVYLSQKVQNMKEMFVPTPTPQIDKNADKKTVEVDTSDFTEKAFYTVEELFKYRKNLAGKSVTVKAKVRKVSHQIMKRDWIHLEDGTGSENMHTNDIVFTAIHSTVKEGDSVNATGTIVIDKDFGYGYFYPVLAEKAIFVAE